MTNYLSAALVALFLLLPTLAPAAQEVSPALIKGLDEQVQEIKGDVLAIAAELQQLEEKLLYPSDTQVAVFVALAPEETLRLDAVALELDGQPVASHLYTFKELEALRQGGVQRLHTGNIRSGEHTLQVTLKGQTTGGEALTQSQRFTLHKAVGPALVELTLAGRSIALKEW